ncbi:MAG: NusG domain II-containing protein [Clostridiales bacterium]|nr:NusG domain II-containing protein [Clostridiales bacterium]
MAEDSKVPGKSNRFWLILILLILLAAAAGMAAVHFARETGGQVRVTQDGQVVDLLPLDQDCTKVYETDGGGRNVLVIEKGQVRMEEASCPDQVCVRHGPTDQTADPIVCLPNHLVAEVITPGDEAQLDGVS